MSRLDEWALIVLEKMISDIKTNKLQITGIQDFPELTLSPELHADQARVFTFIEEK